MPTFRKILLFGDEQTLANRPTRKIPFVAGDSQFHYDRPRIVLHRAHGEKIVQGPDDILKLLREEGIVQEGLCRVRNPITHGECSFVITLVQHQEALVALSVALVPAIIAWLKSRKGRKIEIQKGNLKVSAPNEKALAAALKSLAKYEKLTINVNKAESKRKKQRANSNRRSECD
jgi:hypothetical protein